MVHRRSYIRVMHQLLLHTNRSPQVVHESALNVPEGKPAENRDTDR
jgi:hypothetical protein